MTPVEDTLRSVLREMADEVRPVPLLTLLEQMPPQSQHRRRLVLAVVAAAVAGVVALGSFLLLRADRPSIVEPVQRPPKVFRISGLISPAPGRAQVAVISPQSSAGVGTVHIHSVTGGPDVTLTTSEWVPDVYFQHLSNDGTRVVRQYNSAGDPRLEVVNLLTGSTNRLGDHRGYCPQLSPDNRKVAAQDYDTGRLVFIDRRSGKTLPGGHRSVDFETACAGIGWSPDGRLLVYGGPGGTLVLDERGRTVARIPHKSAVNSAMSWSPDGHSILLYDWVSKRYLIRNVSGGSGSESVLDAPADALRPLGWAGSQIVWLVGQQGDQRLVVTDQAGAGPRPWMRLQVGDRPIETVQWSRDLSGWPADANSSTTAAEIIEKANEDAPPSTAARRSAADSRTDQ